MNTFLVAIYSLAFLLGLAAPMTQQQYNAAFNAAFQAFNPEENRRMIATTVRLAFHDCVGHCNGCVNVTNPSNGGLQAVISFLEPLYAPHKSVMSRADYWAVASLAAIAKGIDIANEGCPDNNRQCTIPLYKGSFRWGRTDCATSPLDTIAQEFPTPLMNSDEMFAFFLNHFGFNKNEVVALMGAHTLGGAQPDNTGYRGLWINDGGNEFDATYYVAMLDETYVWTPQDRARPIDRPKWQFFGVNEENNDVGMMLNTDFELLFDLQLDASGRPQCTIRSTCPELDTADLVADYAETPARWLSDFEKVYTKMLDFTNATLRNLT